MSSVNPSDFITKMLTRINAGDKTAASQLLPLVYGELRALAQNYLREHGPTPTLQATALVHEAYIRLVGRTDVVWEGRAHFFAVSARAMRQILVDYARARQTAKRGGSRVRITTMGFAACEPPRDIVLLDLHEALTRLAAMDPRQSQIVELRFFGGLKMEEVARVLGLSKSTVEREWRMARAWLTSQLERNDDDSPSIPAH